MKPLYNIPKAFNHWFATYHTHHKKKLKITKLIYDLCFFYRSSPLVIVGMPINDIQILTDNNFANKKKKPLEMQK